MAWKYERQERQFPIIPEGDYRIRVRDAQKAQSKAGRDMLALQFDVSGRNEVLYHYIVFLDDKPETTNRYLTNFFDSFKDIKDGDFNIKSWIGKVGACRIRHEESDYNGGTTQAKIHYFIAAGKQGDLPPWKEPGNGDKGAGKPLPKDADGFMHVPEGEDGDFDVDGIPLF